MGLKYILKHNIVPKIKKLKKIKNFIGLQYKTKTKKILMTGGYGYSNVGDEAQCNATANLLKKEFPEYELVVLTPNPEVTFRRHGVNTDYAPRVAFWGHYCNYNIYNFEDSFFKKILFILRGFVIIFNAILVKYNLPTLFINAKAVKLLEQIKESSLFYYSGGGFLTGKTLSRLWDGIFVCRICHILNIPVVMSGQTVGVWGNWFNKMFASWGFKHVKIITSRDKNYTLQDLRAIDTNANIFETHDDALFCQKSQEKFYEGDYVAINFHYWSLNEKEIEKLEAYMEEIVNIIPYKIVLLSMTPPNETNYETILRKFPDKVELFEYDYDFRKLRRVIADSKFCVTMKHHPIIFAYGEDIPVISIVHSDYYYHKNIGAQSQYGQEKFCIILNDNNFMEKFKYLLSEIMSSDISSREIKEAKKVLSNNKAKFIKEVKKVIKV